MYKIKGEPIDKAFQDDCLRFIRAGLDAQKTPTIIFRELTNTHGNLTPSSSTLFMWLKRIRTELAQHSAVLSNLTKDKSDINDELMSTEYEKNNEDNKKNNLQYTNLIKSPAKYSFPTQTPQKTYVQSPVRQIESLFSESMVVTKSPFKSNPSDMLNSETEGGIITIQTNESAENKPKVNENGDEGNLNVFSSCKFEYYRFLKDNLDFRY